ncbi:hypothetical protein O6H91_08G038000 [Diphasiastrum complanatum]|uniref:Uncharacterized protein n=1 Tax=Diphasiastrum complanatum TaxID=34168 RepID=A0ACC2CWM7_DIPCM|nr:hypothetical protein O6H91_08G038000 [Diphasiastrum complanatum]
MEEDWKTVSNEENYASVSDLWDLTEADMLEEIWKDLPSDILERILPWVPVRHLLRLRAVCKDWRSIFSAKSFQKLYSNIYQQEPWLLLFPEDDTTSLGYDPSSCKWITLPFNFLPLKSRSVASDNGLVCSMPKIGHSGLIYVCNPILKTWREVTRPLVLSRLFFLVIGVIVEKASATASSSFKIVVAGSELISEDSSLFNLTTEVFDSRSSSWRRTGSISVETPISAWKAVSNGVMYCLTRTRPNSVIGYNVAKGLWTKIEAPMPGNMTSVMLIDHRSRLHMVGGVRSQGVAYEICIWELQNKNMEWVEVERMPKELSAELLMSSSKRFTCVGHGDLIYFSSKWFPQILLFSFSQRTWQWLQCCPGLLNPHYCMLRGLSFDPRLDV